MRGFYISVVWILSSTTWTEAVSTQPKCHSVLDHCKESGNLLQCMEQNMKDCSAIRPRNPIPNYFIKSIDSSVKSLKIDEEYVINISDEALQRSKDGLKNNVSQEVKLKVYLLEENLFKITSSSEIKEGNDQNVSDPILLKQSVLGVWLGRSEVNNLSQPVQLNFRNTQNQTENGICVYWHLEENGRGNWSTDGCKTSIINGDFVCSCNHLSFFAVLISPQIPEESHIVHLNYISYVGSALSIAFTALIIVWFLCQRKKQCEHSLIIHVQLSCCLFLLHISFVCSVWFSGQRDTGLVCQTIGLLLHWCLLATFTWMAIEGFHLYLLLVRVFNIYIKRYLLKLSLVGWGVPTITVMICGVAKVYGKYTFYMDKENSTATPLCWVTTKTVIYITVNGYLGLVLLFNMAMLGVVVVKMHQLRLQNKQADHQKRAWKDCVSLLGLCFVLGVPWGLAFSTQGPLSVPALYAFTILNSFQGVFIFLWVLTLTCQSRKEKQTLSKGTMQVSYMSNEDNVTSKITNS